MDKARELAEKISLEDAVGQTLMPTDRGYSREELREVIRASHLGCFFVRDYRKDNRETLIPLRNELEIPLIFAADMEHNRAAGHGLLPTQMAAAATASPELAEKRACLLGREARALGNDWLFQPVLDLNGNPASPEMNVRTYGDDPETVKSMVLAHLKGLRRAGIAAAGKHFPGAGIDDRDQHFCTSVNPLSVEDWIASFGKVWRAAIDAGLETVMPGHISFPAWCKESESEAMPATLEPRLMNDLLRRELGFEGVIVSDAATMIGITSRCPEERCAVEFLKAGGDVYLFADPVEDFRRILDAVHRGYLSEERVRDAAYRVLRLKEKLAVGSRPEVALTQADFAEADRTYLEIAEKSATVVRGPEYFPVSLSPESRVLTVTIRWPQASQDTAPDLPLVDELLRAEGFTVDHLVNPPHTELREKAADYGMIFVNVVTFPHALVGTMRMVGPMIMPFWRAFYTGRKNVVFTSFGSPYLLHEQPHWPNLLVLYSPSPASQRAAVKVWLGRLPAPGRLPVSLAGRPRPR
ncbi:MAG: hypothetical protein IJU70_12825 [Lentisphaeria bacterium]|nr:hypothetical protein [Lentisphaeria bacterium]